MVSEAIKKRFNKEINLAEEFNVNTIMRKLKISRPTATNLISNLFNSRKQKIMPIIKIGDKQKWYIRKF